MKFSAFIALAILFSLNAYSSTSDRNCIAVSNVNDYYERVGTEVYNDTEKMISTLKLDNETSEGLKINLHPTYRIYEIIKERTITLGVGDDYQGQWYFCTTTTRILLNELVGDVNVIIPERNRVKYDEEQLRVSFDGSKYSAKIRSNAFEYSSTFTEGSVIRDDKIEFKVEDTIRVPANTFEAIIFINEVGVVQLSLSDNSFDSEEFGTDNTHEIVVDYIVRKKGFLFVNPKIANGTAVIPSDNLSSSHLVNLTSLDAKKLKGKKVKVEFTIKRVGNSNFINNKSVEKETDYMTL